MKRRGFTLAELVVSATLLILTLGALLSFCFGSSRSTSRTVESADAPILNSFVCTFEQDVGGKQGLVRLTLSVTRASGVTVSVTRHFRPDARVGPPDSPRS